MKAFNKINNIAGWLVFAIALVTYALTVERTASFWDCGEFIAVSYKLMVPHPPGAPFFLLMGRLFSMFAFGDVLQVSYWVNMLSVVSSAFTVLFLFWTIVLFARKLMPAADADHGYSPAQKLTLMGAGVVGALAYTFSDTFWFSAAEAEVYAMSSFFTAIVIWATLKWDLIDDRSKANRWLLFIAYTVGLSIGVHLLNLVAIPALALIIYFKRYKDVTPMGVGLSFLAGLAVIGIIMVGIIPGLPSMAASFEIFFVNTLGMPFGSGMIFFATLIISGLVFGVIYTQKMQKEVLNTVLLSLTFVLMGYASYGIVLIRSQYDPPIDENDPENLISFVSYLKREQYGDRPLLFGPNFGAERDKDAEQRRASKGEKGAPIYRKSLDGKRYEIYDYRIEPLYKSRDLTLLPRMHSQQGDHVQLYRNWANMSANEKPSMGSNIYYMLRYQFGHMYFRYFMWNFAGRDSDDKEAGWLYPWDTNDSVPYELASNKARTNFYMLPLILGLVGFFHQLFNDKKNFWVNALLFFFMGLGLVIYLNSPPVEPRERDYIYVGSFYAFCIWIGLGVVALGSALSAVMKNGVAAPAVAFAITMAVPAVMVKDGWKAHNRSNRYHSIDQAKNTLRSCAPNAILFTGGDNDTFPLWYVQNVEGFRTDVRVVVLSYFSTDWYVEQMRRKMYESQPMPMNIAQNNYRQGKNDYLPVIPETEGAVNLKVYLEMVEKEHPRVQVPLIDGSYTAKVLSNTFYVDVDSAGVIAKGIIPKGKEKSVTSRMYILVKEGHTGLYKSDLGILDLIATNNWERPIYFNNTSANTTNLEFDAYLQLEGMAYRLLPVMKTNEFDYETGEVNTEMMLKNLATFEFRGFEDETVWHDEEYRKFGANERNMFFRLAFTLHNEGRNAEAKKVMDDALTLIPDKSIPYSYYEPRFSELYHLLGEHQTAEDLAKVVGDRAEESLDYVIRFKLNPLKGNKVYDYLQQKNLVVLNQLAYTYRRLDADAGNQLSRMNAMVALNTGTVDVSELEKLKAQKAKYQASFQKYSELYAKFSQGLKNPEEYVRMSNLIPNEPIFQQKDTTPQQ